MFQVIRLVSDDLTTVTSNPPLFNLVLSRPSPSHLPAQCLLVPVEFSETLPSLNDLDPHPNQPTLPPSALADISPAYSLPSVPSPSASSPSPSIISLRPSILFMNCSRDKEKATPKSPRILREVLITDPWFGSPTASPSYSISPGSQLIPLATLPPSISVGDENYDSEDA
ncbi:hypothetical protein NE237_016987 [Protea cynaroides]|uniref:Uncharacterized protein n=1 Tax=Protea cynaroides TaxID=273540 RepID=A0A9Q0K769_9MAGN|nr:hypothetical protein NE237_016987 [Protea cynaroides]